MHISLARATTARCFLARGESPPAKPPSFPPLPEGSVPPISKPKPPTWPRRN